MTHTLKVFTLCIAMLCSNRLQAQYSMAPHPPAYAIVTTPGATLAQVMDTMTAHTNANDTGEGGAIEQVSIFANFWQQRVSANDGSGVSMFSQYYAALKATALSGSSACTAGGYQGAWEQAGPDSLQNETSGYVSAVWAGSGADRTKREV